ncbi:exodeoxyribonuclease VII small subunit [bacterium]|mgnify:CR=1 FL=1|jgi:exodeoxyribonuclease VII small subunit|nr:exodeoxyribonuclease VII small subunit [bacterium]
MTLQDQIKQLEEKVTQLESTDIGIDDAISQYGETVKLAKSVLTKLDSASQKIQTIQDGIPTP